MRLDNATWPILLGVGATTLAEPLERHFHLPFFVTVATGFVAVLGWLTAYGVVVWRQAEENRRALQEKHDAALARLFQDAT